MIQNQCRIAKLTSCLNCELMHTRERLGGIAFFTTFYATVLTQCAWQMENKMAEYIYRVHRTGWPKNRIKLY